MAQALAEERGFLPIRLDLTAADVASEQAYLGALYEALFLGCKRRQYWADKTTDVYRAFRTAMTEGNAGPLREFCDVAFPQSFASASTAGRSVQNFSAQVLIEDLNEGLRSGLPKGAERAALIIDEGDHLAQLPSVLEKLRYAMGSAAGLFVIVAGTELMLASMDSVFAPIVRQFKRIRLRPFISASETRECLQQRLRKIGEKGLLSPETYQSLHDLVQGHPYEAQLVAHYAYRRYTESPEEGFSITISVLNEVLAQVERFRAGEHDRFATTLRGYSTEELFKLSAIVLFPKLSLYDKARFDVALTDPGRVKEKVGERRRELKSWAEKFGADRIVTYDPVTKAYALNGNQFDRLYAKLLARSKQLAWREDDRTLEELSEEHIAYAMVGGVRGRRYPPFIVEGFAGESDEVSSADERDMAFVETRYFEVLGRIFGRLRSWFFREMMRSLAGPLERREFENRDLVPTAVVELGTAAADWFGEAEIPTARVKLVNTAAGGSAELWVQPDEVGVSCDAWSNKVGEYLREHAPGMRVLGWEAILVSVDAEATPSLLASLELARARDWEAVEDEILAAVGRATVARYRGTRTGEAEELAATGCKWGIGAQRTQHLNNSGYMRLSAGDLAGARALLEESVAASSGVRDLPCYNLAVCKALQGEPAVAREELETLLRDVTAERIEREEPMTALLILQAPRDKSKPLTSFEERDVQLKSAIRRSLDALS